MDQFPNISGFAKALAGKPGAPDTIWEHEWVCAGGTPLQRFVEYQADSHLPTGNFKFYNQVQQLVTSPSSWLPGSCQ